MTTPSKAPLDVVQTFLGHFERMETASAMSLIAEDCLYTNPPPFGAVRGPAAMGEVLVPFFAPVLENELRILQTAVSGNTVFVERLDRHRLPDKWVELPVTGVFEVKDGLITVWRDYFDMPTIMSEWPTA